MATAPAVRRQEEVQQAPKSQYRLTCHDLDALPDFIKRYELWEGELIMNPAPSFDHQLLVAKLMQAFTLHDPAFERGIYVPAPADVVLREDITVQPDIFYISNARREIVKGQRVIGAPDLCIEILSPSTTAHDINRKRRYYKEAGVLEYWVVDPFEQSLTVYGLKNDAKTEYRAGQTAISSVPALEGLRVDISRLFVAP